MKKGFVTLIASLVTAGVFSLGSIGIYKATYKEPVPAEKSQDVIELFAQDTVKSTTKIEDVPEAQKKYINSAYQVGLEDKSIKAFYYLLTSDKGYDGKVQFSIGIKDNVVSYYKFVKNLGEDPDVGAAEAEQYKPFVGYSLGGADVRAGMTAEETYPAMKRAVDAALTDAQGR